MKKKIRKMSKNEHVSSSDQWKYLSDGNINFFTRPKEFFKNLFENIFEVKIIKKKNYGIITDRQTFLISKNLRQRKYFLLRDIMENFLKKLDIKSSKKKIFSDIKKHDKIFFKLNPIQNNSGGIGYNNSLFLYIFLKNVKVDLIIESGVWQGYTSYIIDQAKKKIKNIKFDINFNKLIYKSKKAKYNEFDIDEYDFRNDTKYLRKSAAFFDDHVSQLKRFLLSDNLNIPIMIFDDDLKFETIHSDGWPAIPTISMIKEKILLKKIKWYNYGRVARSNFKFKFDKKRLNRYIIHTAPNISHITGYYIQSPMTFIKKKIFK